MPKKLNPKYAFLLEHPDMRRWYDGNAQNSLNTAACYLFRFGLFLERTGHTPASFLKMANKPRNDLMSDYITSLCRMGRSISAMRLAKAAAASWLEWNGAKFTRRFKIPRVQAVTRTQTWRIPDQAAVGRIFDAGDTRERLATALEAHAGLRPSILGTRDGRQGLQFWMLPEAHLTPEGIVFDHIPTMIRVPAHLSKVKAGCGFITFLGAEGCAYLAADVQKRIQAGEQLTPESAVLVPTKGDRPFLATWSVSELIRHPMRRAGVKEPPYILRSYFSNRCMMTNSQDLHPDWREFFMGHTNSISFTYATNKGHLPPDFIEALRRGYEAALEHLETRNGGPRKDPLIDVVRALVMVAGVPEEQAKALNLAQMSSDDVVALVRQYQPNPAPAPVMAGLTKSVQRIIQAGELETAIGGGWRVTMALTDGRFIVET